jgi:hypothetical protein
VAAGVGVVQAVGVARGRSSQTASRWSRRRRGTGTSKNTPMPPEHEATRGRLMSDSGDAGTERWSTREIDEEALPHRQSPRCRCRRRMRWRGSEIAVGQKIKEEIGGVVLWVSPMTHWIGPSCTQIFYGLAQQPTGSVYSFWTLGHWTDPLKLASRGSCRANPLGLR